MRLFCLRKHTLQCTRLKAAVSTATTSLQLDDSEFAHSVNAALARHHVRASLVELDITDSSSMSESRSISVMLRKLQNAGVRILVDDFARALIAIATSAARCSSGLDAATPGTKGLEYALAYLPSRRGPYAVHEKRVNLIGNSPQVAEKGGAAGCRQLAAPCNDTEAAHLER